MRWAVLTCVLSGCFSWAQRDPPPRAAWQEPVTRECGDYSAAYVALGAAALSAGGSIAIVESTRGDAFAIEERSWLLLLVPAAVGWTFDAMNAFSDGRECNAYKRARDGVRSAQRP
jgi:hypothetical protein